MIKIGQYIELLKPIPLDVLPLKLTISSAASSFPTLSKLEHNIMPFYSLDFSDNEVDMDG